MAGDTGGDKNLSVASGTLTDLFQYEVAIVSAAGRPVDVQFHTGIRASTYTGEKWPSVSTCLSGADMIIVGHILCLATFFFTTYFW